MAEKALNYTLHQRKAVVGKLKGQMVQVALPSRRNRISFRAFCERVGKSVSFTHQEVAAVLNFATEIAKDIVSSGDSVQFGDLGVLKPSFKSTMVPIDEKFVVVKHILKPMVKLTPSRQYFTLTDVDFERVEPNRKKAKTDKTGSVGGGETSPQPGTPVEGGDDGGRPRTGI